MCRIIIKLSTLLMLLVDTFDSSPSAMITTYATAMAIIEIFKLTSELDPSRHALSIIPTSSGTGSIVI
jgi:hypothetical protein